MIDDDNAAIDVADVTGSEVHAALVGLDLTIAGLDTDPDGERDTAHGRVLSSWPAFGRPKSGAQAWIMRRGDEVLVLAVGDSRYLISLEEGDAVITAAASESRVVLRANGDVDLIGAHVYVGDHVTTQKQALGTTLKSHADAIKSWGDVVTTFLGLVKTHKHAALGASSADLDPAGVVGTPPSVPTLESSKHYVEP